MTVVLNALTGLVVAGISAVGFWGFGAVVLASIKNAN